MEWIGVGWSVWVSSFLLLEIHLDDWREPNFVFLGLVTKASVLIGENQILFLFGSVDDWHCCRSKCFVVSRSKATFW